MCLVKCIKSAGVTQQLLSHLIQMSRGLVWFDVIELFVRQEEELCCCGQTGEDGHQELILSDSCSLEGGDRKKHSWTRLKDISDPARYRTVSLAASIKG